MEDFTPSHRVVPFSVADFGYVYHVRSLTDADAAGIREPSGGAGTARLKHVGFLPAGDRKETDWAVAGIAVASVCRYAAQKGNGEWIML